MTAKKIVLTGGPGGGKTTALDLFKRELQNGVTIVPEAATILFENGFKRDGSLESRKEIQLAIYHLQKSLEGIFQHPPKHQLLLCDRGSLDSIVYWPEGEESFFNAVKSDLQKELDRYHAVIFFESGACSGSDLKSNNPFRSESSKEAIELDQKLRNVWSQHPNFHFIGSDDSFISKVIKGLEMIKLLTSQ